MRCTGCRKDCPDDARFCGGCGARLPKRCEQCGATADPEARFCGRCGQTLDGAPSEAARETPGERRQLTVLFCDLVGSTQLSTRLDPEDLHELVAAYQQAAGAVVERFGGYVAQHLGDGVLAYFGWPHAQDDAAERAVRTGLQMLATLAQVEPAVRRGIALQARVGIHTGAVVVGAIGASGRRETLALGATPNIAARVQALAEPDTVLITEATHRLVAGLFLVDECGGHAMKGVEEPIALLRVRAPSGVRSRLLARASRGIAPFVGRDAERRMVLERWERARDGEGQVVLVRGEPGIGKSRLVETLRDAVATEPHTWIDCAGSPFFANTPFHAVTDMLRQALAWRGDETDEERLAALERSLATAGLPLAEAIPLVAPLIGLAVPDRYPPPLLSAEQSRRQLLATLAAWVIASARMQPMVLVLEDLHWVDASTLDLQDLLLDRCATERLLLVYTTRPEFEWRWSQRGHHTLLTLSRLPQREVHEMIRGIAPGRALSDDVVSLVATRTDGVPLFVEELTRLVLERPDEVLGGVPPTLHDSLMARLDNLGPAKEIAQVASVLGREFSYAMLAALAPVGTGELDAALGVLVDAELLYVQGFPPDATCVFKHVLVQEAAYEALLKSRRRELHRAIVALLNAHFPETASGRPELVAHHLTRAGDAAEAAAAWQRAGEAAMARSALVEASGHFRSGLDVLATLPDSRARAQQELRMRVILGVTLYAVQGYRSPAGAAAFARARELGEQLESTPELLLGVFGLWQSAVAASELGAATELADQLDALATREGSALSRMWANVALGTTRFHRGPHTGLDAHWERTLALYDAAAYRDAPIDPGIQTLGYAAVSAWHLGDGGAMRRARAECLALAEQLAKPFDEAYALTYVAFSHAYAGEDASVLETAERLVRVCTEHQMPAFLAIGESLRGWALARLGRVAEGLSVVQRGVESFVGIGMRLGLPFYLSLLSDVHAIAGDLAQATTAIDRALEAASAEPFIAPELMRARTNLRALQGAPAAEVEAGYRDALAGARRVGSIAFALRAASGLASYLRGHDRADEGRAVLAEACEPFGDRADTRDLVEARALLRTLGDRRKDCTTAH